MTGGQPQKRGPWTVLSTREVYANPWIRVREDQVLRPNGSPGIYGVVHCENAVGMVAVTDDGQVYLVGQYRYPTDEYSWEFPTGTANPGEPPLESARRELREETGLTAARWTPLGRVQVSNSVTDQVGYLYLAQDLTRGDAEPDETEDLVVRTLPLEEAVAQAVSGEISQAFAVVGLLRAWSVLRDQ